MAKRLTTHHSILVRTATKPANPCPRQAECGLWASGDVSLSWDKGSACAARLALTAAGCEICDDLTVTNGDLGMVRVFAVDYAVSPYLNEIEMIKDDARRKLSEVALTFAPTD